MSTPPAPTPPPPTVRALIADFNADPPTITQSTDRELIAKVIRQGGRRVWLDVSDANSTTLDWLAEVIHLPRALFDYRHPFYEEDPVICLPIPIYGGLKWDSASWLIVARAGVLLTLRPSTITLANSIFDQATRSIPDWHHNFNSTLYQIASELISFGQNLVDQTAADYEKLRNDLAVSPYKGDSAPQLGKLLQWQVNARSLDYGLADTVFAVHNMAEYAPISADPESMWRFSALTARLTYIRGVLTVDIENSSSLFALASFQQTAQMNARVHNITIVLFILLPIIVVALWVLILPVQADVRLALWAAATILAVGASLALGRRAKLL